MLLPLCFLGWGENLPGRLFQNANHSLPVSCLLRTRIPLRHSLKYFPVLESATIGRLANRPLTLSNDFA